MSVLAILGVLLLVFAACSSGDEQQTKGALFEVGGIVQVSASSAGSACVDPLAFDALLEARAARDPEGISDLYNRRQCADMPPGARVRVLRVDRIFPPAYKIRLFHNEKNFIVWTGQESLEHITDPGPEPGRATADE